MVAEASTVPDVAGRFLARLSERDYEGLASCFAPDSTLRAIVPPGVREADGPDAIVERFRIWTGDIEDFALVDSEAATFADLLRLRWAVRGRDPGADGPDPTTFEQTAYIEVEDGLIARMRLTCSGERPV